MHQTELAHGRPHRSAHSRHAEALSSRKFLLLFLFLLGTLVLYPYLEQQRTYYVFRVLEAGVILLSVYAVSYRRSLIVFGALLAIPAVLQRILLRQIVASFTSIASIVFTLIFDVFVIVVIFRHIFSDERPSAETIFGALCIYLLIGFSFASLYSMLAAIQPHAFLLDPLKNLRTAPDRFDFIYYSFGTMTALGVTGISSVSDQARSITVVESLLGVLYLAVMIARLMGSYRAGKS